MKRYTTKDRDRSMDNTVSWRGKVPMFRGHAFMLDTLQRAGAPVDVFSADRRNHIITEHNREFKTTLKSQQTLVAMMHAGTGNPANSPNTTSHCLYADATVARLLTAATRRDYRPGMVIPWWALGLDLADRGKHEDVSTLLRVGKKAGFKLVQPYPTSNERHHVMLLASPVPVLEKRGTIAKERRA